MNKASGGDRIPAELFQMLKSAAFNKQANLENSAVATGLEKVSFHSNPREGQCQRMFKLPCDCGHFTCYQSNVQNPSSQASMVFKLRTSRCSSWIQKRQRNQRSNCQHLLDHIKSKGIPKTLSTSASLTTLKSLTVWITTNCRRFFKRQEYQTNSLAS